MPFGSSKRKVSNNVAGRYLAAIGAGTCGEMEDAIDTPLVTESASAAPSTSNAKKSNPLAFRAHHYEKPAGTTSSPTTPITPTKNHNDSRRSSAFLSSSKSPLIPLTASPTQQLNMQPSPSGATATTSDALSQSWATTSSPTSRKSRGTPTRSPVHFNSHGNEKKASSFFSIFPSTKIALRSSNHYYQKQNEPGHSGSKQQQPPPPPPPTTTTTKGDGRGCSSSSIAWEKPNQPQHLLPMPHPDIEMIWEENGVPPISSRKVGAASQNNLGGRKLNTMLKSSSTTFAKSKFVKRYTANQPPPPPLKQQQQQETASSSAGTSDVFSDNVVSEGAPTEVMTNRSSDRRYLMDASDALWRGEKTTTPSATTTHSSEHPGSSSKYDVVSAEEKKQDSDVDDEDSPLRRGPPMQQEQQRFGRQQQRLSHASSSGRDEQPLTTMTHDEEAMTTLSEDELLLYGPVPLERINTRRTSNRGKFTQNDPTRYGQPFQTIASQHQHRRSSHQQSPTQTHPSPTTINHRQQTHQTSQPHHQSSSAAAAQQHTFKWSIPQSSSSQPRLNQHLSRKNGKPIDTKSLFSLSTNESSSGGASPQSSANLLNPLMDKKVERSNNNENDNDYSSKSRRWWSAENVRLTPRGSSPVNLPGHQEFAGSPKKKAVVAYPDSPPSYLKPQVALEPIPGRNSPKEANLDTLTKAETNENKKASPPGRKDESFETHNSDLGVIGLHIGDDDDDDGHSYGPVPKQGFIPKLDPSKQDATSKKQKSMAAHASAKRGVPPQVQPPKVQLKPRTTRVSKGLMGGGEADANTSIVSESSAWSPLAMSEDGLNFASEKDVPLLPLFTKDRFDFFGPNEAFPKSAATNQSMKAATDAEKQIGDFSIKMQSSSPSRGNAHNQRQQLGNHRFPNTRNTQPSTTVTPSGDLQNERQAERPSASPEIWRRGESEANSMASVDPIFCTQSQPPPSSTMVSSIVFDDSILSQSETQSPARLPKNTDEAKQHEQDGKAQTELNGTKEPRIVQTENKTSADKNISSVAPWYNVGHQDSARRWPKVKTIFDGNSSDMKPMINTGRLPDPPEVGRQKVDPPQELVDFSRSHGVPKRSISGPVVPMRPHILRPNIDDACDDSSRQVETGARNDMEKSICSTGSMPRRAKSDQVRSEVKRGSTNPPRGSFQAAFAAFEKANAGRYNKAYFKHMAQQGGETQPSIDHGNPFSSSRLAMVLNAHLELQASESMDNPNALQSDAMSVDVQSIKSNFEGVSPIEDDDDSGSVKSLREVFETTTSNQPETAVSKMRALFEIKKPPSTKNFENGSSEFREVWNKFESRSPPTKHPSNAMKRTRPSSVPNLRDPSKQIRPLSVPTVQDNAYKHSLPKPTQSSTGRTKNFQRPHQPAEDQHSPKVPITKTSTSPANSQLRHSQAAQDKQYVVMSQVRKDLEAHRQPTTYQTQQNAVRVVVHTDGAPTMDYQIQNAISEQSKLEVCTTAVPNQQGEGKPQNDSHPAPTAKTSEQSSEDSIPSDRLVISPERDIVALETSDTQQALTGVSTSSDNIVSPPRLGIQTDPSDENRLRKDYLPKDFRPTSQIPNQIAQGFAGDKDNMSAPSEGEFSDGVTLDLSIADVSQLTNPTAIQSKAGDDSTLGDFSAGERTVEIDLMDCEAKRSEASSSQQTEAAAPLIARALKRLSDDLSLESRNQIAKLWEKSVLLSDRNTNMKSPAGESKRDEQVGSSGWDLSHVEASFPANAFPTSDAFFGFDEDVAQEWETFETGDLWPVDPFASPITPPIKKDQKGRQPVPAGGSSPSRDPDGFHIDGRVNTSLHISEMPTAQGQRFEDDMGSAPSAPSDEAETRKSPLRPYDTRSRVYTQAKLHAKAMLAARSLYKEDNPLSTPKKSTKVRLHSNTGPVTSPRSSFKPIPITPILIPKSPPSRPMTSRIPSRSPIAVKVSPPRPTTTPLSRSPITAHGSNPVSILRSSPARPVTPQSRSPPYSHPFIIPRASPMRPVTPPSRSPPSSQPVTPTHRAVTPTMHNLQNEDSSDSHATPKVSHRSGDILSNLNLPRPSSLLLDIYPDPTKPENGFVAPSQHHAESKFVDSIPSFPSAVDFFSGDNDFSLPAFESKRMMPTLTHQSQFHPPPPPPPKQIDRDLHGSPTAVHSSRVFSESYDPSSSCPPTPIRQRKHIADVDIRASPARRRPEVDALFQQHNQPPTPISSGRSSPKSSISGPSSHKSSMSGQSSPKSPGGRLASVVGKHAALMARLKVLKAARIRRSAVAQSSSPRGSDAGSRVGSGSGSDYSNTSRPKTSIGRAIASVYRSRRSFNSNSTNYIQSRYDGPNLTKENEEAVRELPPSPPRAPDRRRRSHLESPFDEPTPYFPTAADFPDPSITMDDLDFDDYSDSVGSSTRFGGQIFNAALEVD